MRPALFCLLACVSVYFGTVQTAFSALMRLPLRLNAERRSHMNTLTHYLNEPLRFFVTTGVFQTLIVSLATILALWHVQQNRLEILGFIALGIVAFVLVFAYLIPVFLVRKNPEQVLEGLLPSFQILSKGLNPITDILVGWFNEGHRDFFRTQGREIGDSSRPTAYRGNRQSRSVTDERDEQELLHSVVEFSDTLVREVMTPRPDIVAVHADATLFQLRRQFVDQRYSRLPVYATNLDDIVGFVFVKDLVGLSGVSDDEPVIERLIRSTSLVSESKRVAALLRDFQKEQVQIAIVHDKYGGTVGLVTIEDLLEEIVGEIRDEYDAEEEPIVDEGNGIFVFAGTTRIDAMAECLHLKIEREGFETIAGYLLVHLGRVPQVGETFVIDQIFVEIVDGERRRVQRVRVRRSLESESVQSK